ncbi:MAG TPA: hypothetical protein VE685_14285 [Thermoanaerobaculia bacterium]|nr:hypothetical protein [Thermoanaerobaculia bacterium]
MAFRPLQIAVAVAVAAALPLQGTAPQPVDCDAPLPLVLNVGVPEFMVQAEGNERKLGEIREATQKLFQALQGTGACPNRGLQVNLAVGNDYQILYWLGRGAVDVGIVPDLSLHLLQRDRVDLLELGESSRLADDVREFLPGETVRLRAWHAGTEDWRELGEVKPHLEKFRERLLRCAAEPACEGEAARIGYRLALPSHLSPASREQVEETAAWLKSRSGDAALRERFWEKLFKTVRFTFGEPRPARPEPDVQGVIEIEASVERDGGPPGSHLVFLAQSVAKVFRPEAFTKAEASELGELGALLEESPSFAALRQAEPYFGVRRFVFTIPESLALLRQHQRTSGKASLALVLPGGGVKSVYQSRLLEDLYGNHRLENVLASGPLGSAPDPPLRVNYVIGTSGGALLGYFVARIDRAGPFELTDILWRGEDGEFLESGEIFPWTDMPRYASLLVMLGMLAILLVLFSHAPFRRLRIPAGEPPKRAGRRLRLGLVFWPLMLMTPILVRRINGLSLQEHVPVIEGIFYTLCTALAVFADQCLALREQDGTRETKTSSVSPWLPLSVGGSLVGLTFLWSYQSWLDLKVPGWQALVVIAILLFGVRYQLPIPRFRCGRDEIGPGARVTVACVDCAAVTFASVGLLAIGGGAFSWVDQHEFPDFILAFVALLFAVMAIPLLEAPAFQTSRTRGWSVYVLMLLAVALAVVLFSRPAKVTELSDLLLRDSRMDIKLGSLLVCIGIFLLLSGVRLWIARSPRYQERLEGFRQGLQVCLLQIVLVTLILWGLGKKWPAKFPALELTWDFWKWLLVVSFGVALLLVVAGLAGRSTRRLRFLFKGLEYLCSHHQSGSVPRRRILRIVGASCFAFLWWNFILAPALYGNGQASKFLTDVVVPEFKERQFDLYRDENRFEELTVPLVVTANRLETDGTRYFLVVPRAQDACPPILQKPGSGAIWYSVHLGNDPDVEKTCENPLDMDDELAFSSQIQPYVFASGSPFPVFAAHRVYLSEKEGEEQADGKWPLVDGGYSSNVPVDGAVSLSAGQALILNSTPWETEKDPVTRWTRTLGRIPGVLVGDLIRLPGFLFERSQQVDRLRKQELFVVSFTPTDREGWPGLTDFRRNIIENLKGYAEDDRERRIGMVESWGPPSYQLSVLVGNGGGSPSS